MKLEGKQVLIIGGTAGIGFALARELSLSGAHVTLCGPDAACLDQALAALPDARGLVADVNHESGRQRLCDAVEEQGGLDLLVSNAGTHFQDAFADPDAASIERELYQRAERDRFTGRGYGLVTQSFVNLMGPVLLAYGLLPALRVRSGTLVNVASGLACPPAHDACVYSAGKSALASLSRGLRQSAARDGVRVVEVTPPLVATETAWERGEGRRAFPEAVAKAIAEGLVNDRSRITLRAARFVPWLARLHLPFASEG